jgi:hypothetical protein
MAVFAFGVRWEGAEPTPARPVSWAIFSDAVARYIASLGEEPLRELEMCRHTPGRLIAGTGASPPRRRSADGGSAESADHRRGLAFDCPRRFMTVNGRSSRIRASSSTGSATEPARWQFAF